MLRRLRWKLLNTKQRRHQQIFFCIVAIGFLTSVFNFFLYPKPDRSRTRPQNQSLATACHCSQSSLITYDTGECFFNELICYPGFTGDDCASNIVNESYRNHCPINSHRSEWNLQMIEETRSKCINSTVARNEWNISCLFLCFYHRLTGVIQVPSLFWHRSLKNELNYWRGNPMVIDDRLYEHVQGFAGYRSIPARLKSVAEIGAGPFTQTQHLLTPSRSIERITLIEPNALEYMKMNNCAYRGGHLLGRPVKIFSESIEQLLTNRRKQNRTSSDFSERYSAVISINVVEHVSDALEYFRGIYDLLEDGGFVIFHERWYDYPRQADCVLDSPENLHPIRLTRWVIDRFLDQFHPVYVNYNQTERQKHSPCFEHGIYFIGLKQSTCPSSLFR